MMGDSLMRRSLTGNSLDGSLMSSVSMQDLPNLPGVRRDVAAINPKLYKEFKASRSQAMGSVLEEDRPYYEGAGGADDHSLHSYLDDASNFDFSRVSTAFPSQGHAYNDLSGRYSLVSQNRDRLNKSRSLPYTRLDTIPSFVKSYAGRVSIFVAYFMEPPTEMTDERCRKVEIKFYHEDNSIEIIEPRIENSGILQGKFLKRHQIFKPVTRITPASTLSKNEQARKSLLYTIGDMTAGAQLEIYNRVYTIVDCDLMTKQYMAETMNMPFGAPLPLPSNLYDPKSRPGMSRAVARSRSNNMSSGASTASSAASTAGGSVYTAHGGRKKRSGFFEYDRKVLRFFGVWDSRETLFGDQIKVKLHYTLADDKIEIVQIPDRNNGRDPLNTLLKKTVIMKKEPVLGGDFAAMFQRSATPTTTLTSSAPGTASSPTNAAASPTNGGGVVERPYHWSDLHIGDTIAVASMNILLIDADAFTRQFYQEKQCPLGAPIALEEPVYPEVKSEIPPYNGFGSEEDSLQTCKNSLIPTAPMKDGMKMNLFQGMILRFAATLHNPREADKSREFIIQVHLEDDTFQIREPPKRNTGHKGGIFLSRCKLESHSAHEQVLTPTDMYIGATVTILSHQFVIHDCDQYTFKYMEDNSTSYTYSNIATVNDKVRARKDIVQRLFLTYPALTSRMLNVDELAEILIDRAGLALVKQEVCTMFRAVDAQREGSVKMTKMLKYVMDL